GEPPTCTPLPYTTLFRSPADGGSRSIKHERARGREEGPKRGAAGRRDPAQDPLKREGQDEAHRALGGPDEPVGLAPGEMREPGQDRKSTRLNSSHGSISY